MQPIKVAIIGMGPRGLTVLERMLEHARTLAAGTRLQIEIFDSRPLGEGAHDSRQPDHLLINTVSSQVTMFAPSSLAGAEQDLSLVQWARREGYRRVGALYCRTSAEVGEPITDADHLPRSLLGEYLAWFYQHLARQLPSNIALMPRPHKVIDLIPKGESYDVVLENGDVHPVDYAVIATGHGNRQPTAQDLELSAFTEQQAANNRLLSYFPSPYPAQGLDRISSLATVAIQGFGLTAHDVISALTLGRGGRYIEHEGRLKYLASGEEPRLLLFSRNCLPFAARGINQKGLTGKHTGQFFTPAAMLARRERVLASTGSAQLDFRHDVLPLIIKEMAYAYRIAATAQPVAADGFEPSAEELVAINGILWPLDGQAFASQEDFGRFFESLVRDDLAHALKGNIGSPVKAATDVLRDTREALRVAVEYSGLSPASHQYFVEHFNAITNRVSFGPPRQRNFEYLALREAGLIDIAGGPGAQLLMDHDRAQFRIDTYYPEHIEQRYADVVVVARLDTYSPLSDAAALTKNLLARGLIQPYRNGGYHPGGIDIDADLHPLNLFGKPEKRLWAIGYPVEGLHFYTHALPRPGIASRQTQDAQRCVLGLWESIAERQGLAHLASANDDCNRSANVLSGGRP
ncbi:FAD/NAD(P)-binding protein [Pseudomonas sp. MWU13-2105]|uniref:FAD/NAD(P)-binding protein n=1 Tax=Pseudomonas sp. MWU13-2105 TaxID=2935074 RepID=UPI00200F533D|nr:FAD/NAD(P)-binding protein [Pseudomonas sp. MWU13-2105]